MGRMKRKHQRIAALAALIPDGTSGAPGEVQLLPAGEFRSGDVRPKDVPAWIVNRQVADNLIAAAAQRTNPYVIDFEHQTLYVELNGQPAPAAGWFRDLEWREGVGLFAVNVEWTDRARQMIAAGEYRFISPVFSYGPDGRVRRLYHAALTNDAGIDGMAAVAARAEHFHADHHNQPEESAVDEETLAALGLKKDASAEEIKTAVAAMKAQQGHVLAALGLKEDAGEEEVKTTVAALTTKAGEVDETKEQLAALKSSHQPNEVVTALRGQVADLTKRVNERDVDDMVKPALEDGRLLKEQETWARELGESNPAALKKYLDTAQPIAALRGMQSGGSTPPESGEPLTDEQRSVAGMFGNTAEDLAKYS